MWSICVLLLGCSLGGERQLRLLRSWFLTIRSAKEFSASHCLAKLDCVAKRRYRPESVLVHDIPELRLFWRHGDNTKGAAMGCACCACEVSEWPPAVLHGRRWCGRVVDASQHVLVNRQTRGIASRRGNAIQCGVGDVSIAYLI